MSSRGGPMAKTAIVSAAALRQEQAGFCFPGLLLAAAYFAGAMV
jgi:hypothetical protein